MCQTEEELDTCRYCKKEIEDCVCTIVCECGCELNELEILDGDEECEDCRKKTEANDWIESTIKEIEALAVEHGWRVVGGWNFANTGSRYAELLREGGEDDEDVQTLKVRVSDHGSCYCSEDISIAKDPSGDDHSVEVLAAALAKPFEADDD